MRQLPTSFSWILGGKDFDEVRDRYLEALAALDEELAALEEEEERDQAAGSDGDTTPDSRA